MFEGLKEYFRRRCLKKYRYMAATGLRSLDSCKTAAVVLNVEDPAFESLKKTVQDYFKARGIKCELYFFDFRKIEKEELLITSMKTTIIKRELNWYDRPDVARIDLLVGSRPYDMLVSLVPDTEFPIRFVASCLPANFKIGIKGYDDCPYDLVVSAPTPSLSFKIIAQTLEKIQ